jgi:hypothetical protein
MERLLAAIILGGLVIVPLPVTLAKSEQIAIPQSASKSETASADLPTVPPGKSTILGGQIRNVDPVRDELTLTVFGQRPTKILFDERTQVYRDGKKIPLRDLRSDDHASVETVLDGTNVFALSIHIVSRSPQGEYQGRVLSYDPDTGELIVSAVLAHEPIKLLVPLNTPIVREGQAQFAPASSEVSDLVKGSLISVKFESDKRGRDVANRIVILTTPGSSFLFSGNLSSLDIHSGLLVLVDPRDNKSYRIFIDSAHVSTSQNLHGGDQIRVTGTFDGIRYVASAITVN